MELFYDLTSTMNDEPGPERDGYLHSSRLLALIS